MGSAQQPGEPRPSGETGTVEQPSDAELIAATRGGDTSAYGQLYERHIHAARKLGRILARDNAEADDLASETFAKVLATLRDGRGPDLAFRAYLLTTLRNTFYDRVRKDKKVEFTDDMTRHDVGEEFQDTAVAGQERRYAARAFHRLPERWQMVLWHTEVEGESAADVAPLLGLSANGVAALAYRARERLKQMYLQEHLTDATSATCAWTVDRLGARVRGGLSNRDGAKVDQHLKECTACKVLFVELNEVNSSIRVVLAPVVLGIAAPAYLGGAAVKTAAVAGWFGAVGLWFKDVANWVRRFFQQLGGRGAAIAGGAAAVAGILALILVANNTPPSPPDPPSQAQDQPPQDDQDDTPPDDSSDDSDTPPDDSTDQPEDEEEQDEPGKDKDKDDDEPDQPDPPAQPTEFNVDTDLTTADLVAGGDGTLPVTVTSPKRVTEAADSKPKTESKRESGPVTESGTVGPVAEPEPGETESGFVGPVAPRMAADAPAEPVAEAEPAITPAAADAITQFSPRLVAESSEVMTLTVTFGEGISSPGGDAGDGWSCRPGDATVTCTRDALKPGRSTTADVPLAVAPEVTGFHDIDVSVKAENLTGAKTLRVPVAPVGMRTAYASNTATGVASAGNTLLTCAPAKHCDHGAADNHTSIMKGYTADDAPDGLGEHTAVSGARLNIPDGARVLWAGLHWVSSGDSPAPSVKLATPGSGWQSLSAQRQYSGSERPVRESVADITGRVGGGGEFWVAADTDALPRGIFKYAGWSMTVVYQQSGAAAKETAVYEGLAQPRAEDTLSVSLPGAGTSQLAYTLWDGDRTLTGDNLDVDGTTIGQPGNLGHGSSPSALEGGEFNTFGVDVNTATVEHGDDAHATFFTGADPLEIGVLAVATPPP